MGNNLYLSSSWRILLKTYSTDIFFTLSFVLFLLKENPLFL